jgi:hypothetical protein
VLYRNIDAGWGRRYIHSMIELDGGPLEQLKAAARLDPEGEAISYRGKGLQVEVWYLTADADVLHDEYRYVVCENGRYTGCLEPDVLKYFE